MKKELISSTSNISITISPINLSHNYIDMLTNYIEKTNELGFCYWVISFRGKLLLGYIFSGEADQIFFK